MSRKTVGTWLVALQLALIATLAAIALPAFVAARAPLGAWLMAAAGGLLGLWSLACNRPGNFNIRPQPRAGSHLVRSGPYRWIRHPMYTAVTLCGAACAWAGESIWGWACLIGLCIVLATKATLEERWMLAEHPGYAEYRAGTRRFVPWVF
jgi:protein-S-isoprenylcysteine O-methyltransferase Ste14